jgi:hypothetical protein
VLGICETEIEKEGVEAWVSFCRNRNRNREGEKTCCDRETKIKGRKRRFVRRTEGLPSFYRLLEWLRSI